MTECHPYRGESRKLILSMDLGTTYSGVSYSILESGAVPIINSVTRYYEGQPHGDSKTPTVLLYNKDGNLHSAGEGAMNVDSGSANEADRKGQIKFKLHVKCTSPPLDIPPLSNLKDIVMLFSDFYKYLYDCASSAICTTGCLSESSWEEIAHDIHFILAHPNGWEGKEQAMLRDAMVKAQLIPDDDEGHAHVSFVTEGEASLHFCLAQGIPMSTPIKEGIVIVDAGSGTIDISTYTRLGNTKKSFEEISVLQCRLAGSIFVTHNASCYFAATLRGTQYAGDIKCISELFDKAPKTQFRNPREPCYILFSSMRDTDPKLNVHAATVARFFEPSLNAIKKTLDEVRTSCKKHISNIFLVSSFGGRNYLYDEMKLHLSSAGIELWHPEKPLNKAVSEGAISFYLDHFVRSRISRYIYGSKMYTPFNREDLEHRRCADKTFVAANGKTSLDNQFDIILSKDVRMSEETEFRKSYFKYAEALAKLSTIEDEIIYYRGTCKTPRWMDTEEAMYRVLCSITADTREAARTLELQHRPDGKVFYKLEYDVVLLFGYTELKAFVSWKYKASRRQLAWLSHILDFLMKPGPLGQREQVHTV
ncbi:hypothetical protein EV421DRAFT_1717855 [Armillaria borealis]|uniref:Uncharacterized protein n=1 Tax=Armillaria borealis TaxID=47425 RepID=A0AA39J2J3_9AGAR|nr:hypothetical protein EV421DRAFT_1717855 [Armillaria borealis]